MPNCIQLTRIGSREPSTFQDIDTAICASLGFQWDETRWAEGWYDFICFALACGRSFEWIGNNLQEQMAKGADWALPLLRINHFLLENYTSDAWYEFKR
jgi:hypothetical protein